MSAQLLPPTELILDVSAALPFAEPVRLVSTVHLPDSAPRAILICWPGGGYGRVYWDMQIPGHPGYSFAEHLTAQGFIVVAADHLGAGDTVIGQRGPGRLRDDGRRGRGVRRPSAEADRARGAGIRRAGPLLPCLSSASAIRSARA